MNKNKAMVKGNKGLLDKKRFEKMEKEKIKYLKNLSLEKSIKIIGFLVGAFTQLVICGIVQQKKQT